MKKKYYLVGGLICSLIVGFAAVATTLIINGNIQIGVNESDFGIYFSKSVLDSTDVSKETISSDGQTIDFNATLTEVNKATELDYEVTNSSKNYDAKVTIECHFQNDDSNINFDDLVSMEYLNNNEIIPARTKGTGQVSLKLKKSVTEDITTKLKCNLTFEAVERESLGETSVDENNNSLSGYLIDENRKLLPNKNLVVLKDENIYITANEEAYLTIDGLDVDFYDIYLIENKSIDEIKGMTNDQIKDSALTHAKFTYSSKEIIFDNGYKIVHELDKHIVNFDPNGGNVSQAKKEVVYKKTYGNLPTPTKDNYVFIGWFTDKDGGNEVTSSTKVETNSDEILYARWEVSDLLVDVVSNLAKTDSTNLSYDQTNENNIRYIGTTPNNYVLYNGELWRIIGVMNNVEDSTGTVSRHAKIIRNESLSSAISYDNTISLIGNGINDWSISKLQKVLNSGAYYNRTSGDCPSGSNGSTSSCDFSETGLKSDAKKMISNAVWKLGAIQSSTTIARDFYKDERGNKIPDNHATEWIGKVGLMYPSDYGFAVGGDVRSAALLTSLGNYQTDDGTPYADYNWLKYDKSEWTISAPMTTTFHVFYKTASLATINATSSYYVRPSLYLSTYVKVVSGDGTKDNPYTLAINNNVRYKVNFDSNGGEKVNTVLSLKNGEKYGTLPSVERSNLKFEGWYTEKDGGTKVTSDTIVDIGDNQTLYAHWTINGILKDGIAELSKSDTTNLSNDNTTEGNIRYIGKNPNNYVSFNGELWRIIGVMKDVEDSTGTTADHVKIIREEKLTNNHSYDNTGNYGINDWSTGALKDVLNNGAYYNRTSGKCPSGSNGYTSDCDYSDIGLKTDAKKMISNVVWKTGGVSGTSAPASYMYNEERDTIVADNHATEWTGKVGLMYPSDYGFAVENAKEISSNIPISNYGSYSYSNWLYSSSSEWTITSMRSQNFLSVFLSGGSYNQPSSNTNSIRPSAYLSSYIKAISGDGTKENPYKLAINNDANYIVEFDANGGEEVNTVLNVKNGQLYGKLPTTERNNFALEGWYTEKNGGTLITSETTVDLADNQTLYAHWKINGILKEGIIEIAKSDKTNLAYDNTTQNNLRYVGENPNNYVRFNNELWRIIGVMNDIEDSTGFKDSHVKIIRDESIGEYSFDNKSEGFGSSTDYYGSSNWTDARIMTTLNDGPYWYRSTGKCYKDSSDATVNCDFKNNGLSSQAKKMISDVVWNLGGRSDNNTTPYGFYESERSENTRPDYDTKWTGYVGLIYPSDYAFAVGGSERSSCLNSNISYWNTSCTNASWLRQFDAKGYSDEQWTITPRIDTVYNVFTTSSYVSYYNASYGSTLIVPTVFLNSNIKAVDGDGTKDRPYELSINDSTSESHIVSFDANGGNNIDDTLNLTYGDRYGKLPNTTRSHFIFDGWYTDEENGVKIEEESVFNYTDNQTLYAHWIANGTPVEVIKELVKTTKRNLVYDGSTDNNLRYVGKDPNNFIWFNDEMWRVIGVMNNVEDSDGNKSSYVKIMKDDVIGSLKWNYVLGSGTHYNSDYSQSYLMPLLNSGAYWNRTNEMYFDGYDTTNQAISTKYVDYVNTGLTENAKSMTSNVVWNLGGGTSSSGNTNSFYSSERGKNPVEGYASTWTGNVGLMYVSDYGHATGGLNRSTCLTTSLSSYYNCSKYNWIARDDGAQWTISPYSYTSGSNTTSGSIFNINSGGTSLYETYSNYDRNVRPVVYLNHNVKMQGGSGTKEKPFRLKLITESLENTHTVTFNSTEGTIVPTVLTVTNGEKYGKLPETQSFDYSFDGWYTEEIGGIKVTKNTIVNLDSDQVLYAHWVSYTAEPGNMITSIEKLAEKNKVDLAYDGTADNNLRYIGSNPNNYVEYNDELWQIIGVMNNVENSENEKASHVKLISHQSTAEDATFVSDGSDASNDWTTSSLNEFINHQLTRKAKDLTSDIVWKLGGNSSLDASTPEFYVAERGTDVYEGKPDTWTGKVGLYYPSDIGYSVSGDEREICISTNFNIHYNYSCASNSWLINRDITLTPVSTSNDNMFYSSDDKLDTEKGIGLIYNAYPVIYLDENVEIKEGHGTKENPYKIRITHSSNNENQTFTVSFNANGGSDTTTILTVTNKEKYGELPSSAMENYSLEGWYTEATGGTKITSNTIANLDSDQTLYAHWVTYVAEAGNMQTSLESLAKINSVDLAYDGTIDNNLRYIGKTPKNYVLFNDELWRIIGVMNNVEDKNKNSSTYIKLIKAGYLYGHFKFNDKYSNWWTESWLQKLLNSGDYYNRTGNFENDGLKEGAKAMISEISWHLGNSRNEVRTPAAFYSYEKSDYKYYRNPTEWTGKVGLMYPSDYGFAVGGDVRDDCLDLNMYLYDRNSCYTNDWMFLEEHEWPTYGQWTIFPSYGSSDVYSVQPSGKLISTYVRTNDLNGEMVQPSIYIKNNINITGGTGTSTDPYTIALSE